MADNAGNVPATPRYISIELSAIAKILLKIAVSENPAKMAQEEAIGVLSMERGRFTELDAAYERSIHGMERSAARQAEYRNKMKQKASQGDSANQRPKVEKKAHDTFRSPSVDDVVQFAIESNLQQSSANEFCDYYESKGWKVGNVKMKDWKAAFRNWVRREVSVPPASEVQTFCAEKGIDANRARDFYRELSSVGWKYRGQKIVDWKPLFLSLRG